MPLDSWISGPQSHSGPLPRDPSNGTGRTSSVHLQEGTRVLKLTLENQASEPKQAAKSYAFPSKLDFLFNEASGPSWASFVAQLIKNPPAMRETWV